MPHLGVSTILGPWLIGICISLVLQGVVLTQLVKYFETYRRDPLLLKALVGMVGTLSLLSSVQYFTIIWVEAIVHYGHLRSYEALVYGSWLEGVIPLFTAFRMLVVQGYFCYRLFVISKNRYIAAALSAIFSFALIASVVCTAYIARGPLQFDLMYVWYEVFLIAGLVGAILLTGTTIYFSLKNRRQTTSQTTGLINTILTLAIQSAAPAAICAVLNLVIVHTVIRGGPAVTIVMPKVYVFSMMWTLNSREEDVLEGQRRLSTSSAAHRGLTEKAATSSHGGSVESAHRDNEYEPEDVEEMVFEARQVGEV
ncbi:hypothetical protein FB45DRAFT_1040219 [Roridomyces roridus]|uniref:DUF6534 domain-containing protein n=1 Tax=Roridomyces roridus TaxID=1738132 RepID=A0AAD7F7T8_9AGAR|nr:hypothetical protein FB45DRAFT_1040219 [Roridomyces roridus]